LQDKTTKDKKMLKLLKGASGEPGSTGVKRVSEDEATRALASLVAKTYNIGRLMGKVPHEVCHSVLGAMPGAHDMIATVATMGGLN